MTILRRSGSTPLKGSRAHHRIVGAAALSSLLTRAETSLRAGRLLLIIARQIGRSPGSSTWRSTPNVLRSAARSISRPLLARVVDYRAVVMIGFEGDVRDRRRGEDIFRTRFAIEPRNLCDRAI